MLEQDLLFLPCLYFGLPTQLEDKGTFSLTDCGATHPKVTYISYPSSLYENNQTNSFIVHVHMFALCELAKLGKQWN